MLDCRTLSAAKTPSVEWVFLNSIMQGWPEPKLGRLVYMAFENIEGLSEKNFLYYLLMKMEIK